MKERSLQHLNPAWRDKTDFIIRIKLPDEDQEGNSLSEQIWARNVGNNLYLLTCVPIFAYGLSLGDIVETDEELWIIKVKTKSNYSTVRFFFHKKEKEMVEKIEDVLIGKQCIIEWYSKNLLGVAIPKEICSKELVDYFDGIWGTKILEIDIGSA
jgi:hypothetical protein